MGSLDEGKLNSSVEGKMWWGWDGGGAVCLQYLESLARFPSPSDGHTGH